MASRARLHCPKCKLPEMVNAASRVRRRMPSRVVGVDNQGKAAFAVIRNVIPARNADFAGSPGEVTQKYTDAQANQVGSGSGESSSRSSEEGRIARGDRQSVRSDSQDGGRRSPSTERPRDWIGFDFAGCIQGQRGWDRWPGRCAKFGQFVCKVSRGIPAAMTQFAKNKEAIVQSLQTTTREYPGRLCSATASCRS